MPLNSTHWIKSGIYPEIEGNKREKRKKNQSVKMIEQSQCYDEFVVLLSILVETKISFVYIFITRYFSGFLCWWLDMFSLFQQTRPTLLGSCNCDELKPIQCHLETKDLWEKFHELGTEMIITKTGRCVLRYIQWFSVVLAVAVSFYFIVPLIL